MTDVWTATSDSEGVALSAEEIEVSFPQVVNITNTGDAGSADLVSYDPSGQDWPGSDPTNVQDAISDLFSGGVGGGGVDSVDGQTGAVDLSSSYDPLGAADTAVAGFGDVVTHDADEFASAAQGATADTALQPGDTLDGTKITGLVPDNSIGSAIARDSEVASAISTHAGATDPHGDRAFTTSAVAALGLDTASTHPATDFATSAQGTKADTAVQPARTVSAGTGLTGGGDLSANRTLAADFGTGSGKVTQGNDSRLSDARTPTAHASSHASAGSDPVTLAQSQVTNLTTDLAAKAPLAAPTFTGHVTVPTPTNTTDATTKAYVDAASSSGTPDADATTKGKLQLAGDLGGTAASPTVPGLSGKVPTTRTLAGLDLSADRSASAIKTALAIAESDVTNLTTDLAGKVPTSRTLAGLDLSADRSASAIKTALSLAKGDVGLGNVDNTSDATKQSAAQTAFDARYQAISAALTSIAGLTLVNDDVLQVKAGAVTQRTMAQLKTDLAIASGDVSGLGSLATKSAVASADITDGTIVNADISGSAAIALSKLATDPLARANHTGTQTASTVSDFDTQVRTSRLDQMAVPTAAVSLNSHKLTNVTDPTSNQDAATKKYVDDNAGGGGGTQVVWPVLWFDNGDDDSTPPSGLPDLSSIGGPTFVGGDHVAGNHAIWAVDSGTWTQVHEYEIGDLVPITWADWSEGTDGNLGGLYIFSGTGLTQASYGAINAAVVFLYLSGLQDVDVNTLGPLGRDLFAFDPSDSKWKPLSAILGPPDDGTVLVFDGANGWKTIPGTPSDGDTIRWDGTGGTGWSYGP